MHPDLQVQSRGLLDDLFYCRRIDEGKYFIGGMISNRTELLDWLPIAGLPVFSERLKNLLDDYVVDVNWVEFPLFDKHGRVMNLRYFLCNLLFIGDILLENECVIDYKIPLGDNKFVFDSDKPDFGKPFLSMKYWGYWFLRRDIAVEMARGKYTGFQLIGL